MAQLPITNGFYESRSLPISAQECTNWYVVNNEQPSLSQQSLFGTPGTVQLVSSGIIDQANRGSHVKNSIPYFVNGGSLYRLNSDFTLDTLGSIEGSGRVSMADNGTQLMILVPGGKGYIYNEDAGTPFQEITDADFTANGNPQQVIFIDGYFAVTTDSKKWIVSALNNGLSWNALDFASAESDPDTIVGIAKANNQAYIIGSITTEGVQNIGGSGFPFQRNNVFLDKGCFAPFTIISTNSTFFMVGGGKDESPAIWRFAGNSYQKISSNAIDAILETYTDDELQLAFAWAYAQAGAYFVGFTFPQRTFVFELTAQKWHERKSTINEAQARWRVNSIVTAYGKVLVGDSIDGRIGDMSLDHYKEYDDNIIRIVSSQPFVNETKPFTVPKLELTMESGVGNTEEKDPQISLAISNDAKIFEYERNRPIGKKGEYQRRAIWRKNGRFPRLAVFRFRLSDPVKPVIIRLDT